MIRKSLIWWNKSHAVILNWWSLDYNDDCFQCWQCYWRGWWWWGRCWCMKVTSCDVVSHGSSIILNHWSHIGLTCSAEFLMTELHHPPLWYCHLHNNKKCLYFNPITIFILIIILTLIIIFTKKVLVCVCLCVSVMGLQTLYEMSITPLVKPTKLYCRISISININCTEHLLDISI